MTRRNVFRTSAQVCWLKMLTFFFGFHFKVVRLSCVGLFNRPVGIGLHVDEIAVAEGEVVTKAAVPDEGVRVGDNLCKVAATLPVYVVMPINDCSIRHFYLVHRIVANVRIALNCASVPVVAVVRGFGILRNEWEAFPSPPVPPASGV